MRSFRFLMGVAFVLASANAFAQVDSLFSDQFQLQSIIIDGNKSTKRFVLLREMIVTEGASYHPSQFDSLLTQSQKNLMNTRLFNFVTLTPLKLNDSTAHVLVEVVERWYIWPQLFFQISDPNFNIWWDNKDFSRVNYGFYLVKDNFRGRREQLKLRMQLGFAEQLSLNYEVPYANKKRTLGFGIAATYEQNNAVNYASGFDRPNRRDFYKNTDANIRTNFYVRPKFIYRPEIHQTHIFQAQYTNTAITDSLKTYATDYLPGGAFETEYLTMIYQFRLDYRDFVAYPLTGYILQLDFTKHGFGLAKSNGLNVLQTYFNVNQYFQISQQFYGAFGVSSKMAVLGKIPYVLQQGLGYGDFVRGFENYIMDAQQYVLFQSNLKWQLFEPKEITLPLIPWEKFNRVPFAFYLNANFDAGYASDNYYADRNPLSNTLLYGTGLGLDFVTYYDKVVRIEYTYNSIAEHGFFFHFKKAI